MPDGDDRDTGGEILEFRRDPARLRRLTSASAPLLDLIFDDVGRSWPVGSKELARLLGYSDRDFDLVDFAIRKMGWVGVRFGTSEITVRLAPAACLSASIEAAIGTLAGMVNVPVRLASRDLGGWREERLESASVAIARLEQMTSLSAVPAARFVFIRQPLEVIFRDKDLGLIRMFQRARQARVAIGRREAVFLAESDPVQMASIALRSAADRHAAGRGEGTGWTWESIARGLRFYDEHERKRLTGIDVCEAPDAAYASWCAQSYARAADAAEPVVEDVRAVVMRSDGTAVESRYRRLLLPFAAADGGSLVLVRSELARPERSPAPRAA